MSGIAYLVLPLFLRLNSGLPLTRLGSKLAGVSHMMQATNFLLLPRLFIDCVIHVTDAMQKRAKKCSTSSSYERVPPHR